MAASAPAESPFVHRYTKEDDDHIVTSAIRTEFTLDDGMTGLSKLLLNDHHNKAATYQNLTAVEELGPPKSEAGSSGNVAHHRRKGTESTMSSSPPVEIDESTSSHHYHQHMIQESGGIFFTSTSSLSPNNQSFDRQQGDVMGASKEVIDLSSKLSSAHKSPIGKVQRQQLQSNPQHGSSHQTMTSSPSLSLTPNSTDAGNFIISPSAMAFSGSGAAEAGPSMPFLYSGNSNSTAAFQSHLDGSGSVTGSVIHHPQQSHHRRGESSSFGSFDLSHGGGGVPSAGNSDVDDDDNDGLFGLDALHFRASAMGSNVSISDGTPALISSATSSPRVTRRQTYHNSSGDLPGSQPRRTSTHSDRPPLSSQYMHVDSSNVMMTGSYMSNNDRSIVGSLGSGDASPPTSTMTGFGAIGQLRLNAAEFDPSRRRSSSDYNTNTSFGYIPQSQPQSQPPSGIAQKFGALPTLSSHIQNQHDLQHNMNDRDSVGVNFAELSKPRHTRSISQPMPPGMSNSSDSGNIGLAPSGLPHDPEPQRYYGAGSTSHDGKSSSPGYSNRNSLPQQIRQGGILYDNLSASNFPQFSGGYTASTGYSHLEKGFDNLRISAESQSSGGNFIGAYTGDGSHGRPGRNSSSSSPGPSQNQYVYHDSTNVGGNPYQHVRHQSDNGSMMNSSQSLPHGLSSSLPRYDDNFSHALAGENIDVPDHEDPRALPTYFGSSGSHPLLRGATHSHSMSLDAIQTQQLMQSAVPTAVYAVKFKRSQRNFILGPRINRDLKIGTYVKVEADRGEDLGIVVGKLPPEKFTNAFTSRSSFTAGMGSSVGSSPADLKRIMRLATHDEVSLLGLKREEEEELLQICRSKVRQRGLRMNVIDAEYQFDRHKLTFFFEAMGRVDFRELVRDLFSMYKTRIWMQQLDKHTSTSAQAMIYPTANLHMDYGTPIIAPTSEFADSVMYGQIPGSTSNVGADFDRSN